MKIVESKVCKIEGDINNEKLYALFEKHTGIVLEFSIEGYAPDSCGIVLFLRHSPIFNHYPTLSELEETFYKFKNENSDYDYYDPTLEDVVNYFRRKNILPEIDFLFNVDY